MTDLAHRLHGRGRLRALRRRAGRRASSSGRRCSAPARRRIQPIGLGARDTLRLEAALALYGNELDDTTTPLAAGLDAVRRPRRRGLHRTRAPCAAERAAGTRAAARRPRARAAPGIARHGLCAVVRRDDASAYVTSGTQSPTLGRAIALAYVDARVASVGATIAVDIRGRAVPAQRRADAVLRTAARCRRGAARHARRPAAEHVERRGRCKFRRDLRYSEEHEWVAGRGRRRDRSGSPTSRKRSSATSSSSSCRRVGAALEKAGRLGVVESVKAVSDVYAPLAGTVARGQRRLSATPGDRSTGSLRRRVDGEGHAQRAERGRRAR